MYTIIKSVINSGNFELVDILTKIDTIWVQGSVTDNQRTELIALARSKATPEATYAPLQEQVDVLAERIDALAARVTVLEAASSGSPVEPPVESDEWPPYVQPTGAHDAYNTGKRSLMLENVTSVRWTAACGRRMSTRLHGSCRRNPATKNRVWTVKNHPLSRLPLPEMKPVARCSHELAAPHLDRACRIYGRLYLCRAAARERPMKG